MNRGYFHVARKNRWYWEETSDVFHLDPGSASVALWPNGTELPNFRSLDKLYIISSGSQRRLQPMSEDEFFENWLSQDLTASSVRGNPTSYYVHNGQLYILSPPSVSLDFMAHYHQRVSYLTDNVKYPLAGATDVPITPPHLDEAILQAAKIRCHMRAQEITLANQERADLQEVFEDMADDEAEIVDELPDRVSPDDTWL